MGPALSVCVSVHVRVHVCVCTLRCPFLLLALSTRHSHCRPPPPPESQFPLCPSLLSAVHSSSAAHSLFLLVTSSAAWFSQAAVPYFQDPQGLTALLVLPVVSSLHLN